MRTVPSLIIVAAATVALAGCSTSAPAATHRAAPKFATDYAQSASVIASHVKACKDVAAADVGKGDQSGMASTATCTILGHQVCFDSWKDASGGIDAVVNDNAREIVYSWGKGWSAFVCDDPSLQQQMTNDAGALFDEAIQGKTPAPADVDGESAVAHSVLESLIGHFEHAFKADA